MFGVLPMIEKSDIENYRALCRRLFGRDISPTEALRQGSALICLLKAIYPYQAENGGAGGVDSAPPKRYDKDVDLP